jgi:hypothetical protein
MGPRLPGDAEDAAAFRASLAETLPTTTMEVVDDLWSA